MFCSIPGANIKVLHKTVGALSKLSDEVYIECNDTSMTFIAHTVNKTSCAKYSFDSSFFFHYECQNNADEPVVCKLSNRNLMKIFKRKMEKKVESCKVNLNLKEKQIVFRLRYKSGITLIHTLHLLNWEYGSWDWNVASNNNKVICKSTLLMEVLKNFKGKDINIYMDANDEGILLRNYGVDENNFKKVLSQIKLNCGEFHSYDVHHNCSSMISYRALKSVLSYAESLGLHLLLSFSDGGKPFCIAVEQENIAAYCVISTLPVDGRYDPSQVTNTSSYASARRNTVNQVSSMEVDTEEHQQTFCNNFAPKSLPNVDTLEESNVANTTMTNPHVMHIFGRAFEPTFHASQLYLGTVLSRNSDSSDDSD